MAEDKSLSRRSFLKYLQGFLAVTGVAVILGPIIAYFWPSKLEEVPSEPVPVGPIESIGTGDSKTIRFGRYPAIVINTQEGIRAYSAVCTHFACIVKYEPEHNYIECPCHEGFFDPLDGSVISGPPPQPLDPIVSFVEDGILYIGGEA
ncbi:MAG: Rieske 2Fe-2S domain-containing protein [Anaerolineales bacterium]|nr:Rieske 2Fe-2S domain-containing protein [Anaerolineales bacterium]